VLVELDVVDGPQLEAGVVSASDRCPGRALFDDLAARLDDPLEAFIGCGASGRRTEPFDVHQERADAASK
jgi:hypothetical protein